MVASGGQRGTPRPAVGLRVVHEVPVDRALVGKRVADRAADAVQDPVERDARDRSARRRQRGDAAPRVASRVPHEALGVRPPVLLDEAADRVELAVEEHYADVVRAAGQRRRAFVAGSLVVLPALRTFAQSADHAAHGGLYERLQQPGRIDKPELAAQQNVFDSMAPKAATPGRWIPRAALPLPRSEMAWAAAFADRMHLVGGYGEQRVVDVDAMVRFYCEVLGCTVERRRDDIGLVQLRAGNALVDLVPVGGPLGRAGGAAPGKEGRNLDHFCFRVEPFDDAAIRAHLARAGVAAGATVSRFGADGEGPSLYLNDPEGNTVELKGPPWSGTADTLPQRAPAG